jgi:hypothetical protein
METGSSKPFDFGRCSATTLAGNRCKMRAASNEEVCGRHINVPSGQTDLARPDWLEQLVDSDVLEPHDSVSPELSAPAEHQEDFMVRNGLSLRQTTPAIPPSQEWNAKDKIWGAIMLAALLVVVVGIGWLIQQSGGSTEATAASDTTARKSNVPAAYGGGEAWSKPYASTTCADWRGVMSGGQRRTFVSDNLIGLRERNSSARPLPSPAQVEGMLSEIVTGCGAGLEPRESMVLAYFAAEKLYGS